MHHPTAGRAPRSTQPEARARGVRRTTLVAIATNATLAIAQVVIGVFANAFSLVADAAHTLSDLVTDVLVLLAGWQGAEPADRNHPYGHGRIETAASMLLGIVLAAVGLGFLWTAGLRLQDMAAAPALHPIALYMALATLAAKEGLFRYTLAASRRLHAPILEANAWHARSDAASSLVVAAGIGGSLAGYPFLEPLAAAVVGFLILNMGARLAYRAVRELVDTGLSEPELARLAATIRGTPGVVGLHDVRTRRMANRVLCDAHVQVEPHITVSEGHYISDEVFFRVRAAHPEVQDVLVHIDAENDAALQSVPTGAMPGRTEIVRMITDLLDDATAEPLRVQIHFLGERIEAEAILPATALGATDADALRERIGAALATHPQFRAIRIFVQIAP